MVEKEKLFAAIDSSMSIQSQRLAMVNAHVLYSVDEDKWPPDQLTDYTPLLFIWQQEQRTREQDSELDELTQTGDID